MLVAFTVRRYHIFPLDTATPRLGRILRRWGAAVPVMLQITDRRLLRSAWDQAIFPFYRIRADQMIKARGTNPIVSIVDDDESVLIAIHSLVSSFGFEAFAFRSAEAFLQSPRVTDTSCLLSDVHMPNVSGIELQRILLERGLQIPTVFMTAFSNESIKASAVAAGAVCFLMKPLDTNTLIGCINTAVERNHDRRGR